MPSSSDIPQSLTAEELVDLQAPDAVHISPDAKHVTYSIKPMGRKGDHDKSSIWLAEVGKEKSARQLTSGSFNDRNPQWSPDGESIAFVSDREEAGKKCAIYVLSIKGGEAYAVTEASYEANIGSIAWSPNGQFIAFTSPDEKSEERRKKDEKKDDVKVYGEEWEYQRLRVLHVATRETITLFKEDAHVQSLSWDPDSKRIAIVTARTPDLNSPFTHGLHVKIVSVADRSKQTLVEFPGAINSDLAWHGDRLLFMSGVRPAMISTAQALYALDLTSAKYEICAYGEQDSAQGLKSSFGTVSVQVQADLHDNIVLAGTNKVLHSVEQYINDYDVVRDTHGDYITAFITSTVSEPSQVFSKSSTDGTITQLSDHGVSVRSKLSATYSSIRCKSYVGKVELDAVWATPTSTSSPKPLPTIVHIHGGPPDRVTNSFDHFGYRWMPWIMSKNQYGFLSVNYRGGTGRGQEFSAYAAGGMGTVEYDDVLALVEEAIQRGLADKERLIVMGWSQGGFLSYLSAVRNGATSLPDGSPKTWKFKGAICGAGVVDWDMMSMSSDAPAFESELVGGTPWGQEDKHWIKGRQGSAIWEFAAAREGIPPILILHGEKDERVPLTQAMAFHRGCMKWGVPCEMAVYPREPHGIKERAHLVDLLKRTARFIDLHLG